MVREEIDRPASVKEKLLSLFISNLLFGIIYNLSGWYATSSNYVGSFVLDFENKISFIPWMVIPYMSSGLLFFIIFFYCSSRKELFLLVKRINFITVISGIIFILFPLKHTFIKPEVESSFLNFFFQFLNTWDTNYNQAPSLHISYALIFWSVFRNLRNRIQRTLLAIWLSLMGISTLTIFQHHLIDIVASFVLVSITFFIFPTIKKQNIKVGSVYIMASAVLLLFALLVYSYSALLCFLLVWLTLVLYMVGNSYIKSDVRFLKRINGTIPFVKKIIYFPYILTYKIIRLFFCKNTGDSVVEIFPSFFIGPMLSYKQLSKWGFNTKQTIIVDLSAETEENYEIRNKYNYYSFPMLDIGGIEQKYLYTILERISGIYDKLNANENIYIHCFMGYSRSAFIAAVFIRFNQNISSEDAINQIRKKYPNAIFPQYLLALMHNIK